MIDTIKFSYFISMNAALEGTPEIKSHNPRINLHDQHYHYLYGTEAT